MNADHYCLVTAAKADRVRVRTLKLINFHDRMNQEKSASQYADSTAFFRHEEVTYICLLLDALIAKFRPHITESCRVGPYRAQK